MSDFFDTIGKRISDTVDDLGKKAGDTIDIQKKKNEIYGLKRDSERDMTEIGRLVYERFKQGEVVDTDLSHSAKQSKSVKNRQRYASRKSRASKENNYGNPEHFNRSFCCRVRSWN